MCSSEDNGDTTGYNEDKYIVDSVDFLIDYAEESDGDYWVTSRLDFSDREGYRIDDDGCEYFKGVHFNPDYKGEVELRRTPEGVMEFCLVGDSRGFMRINDSMKHANNIYI